MPLGECMGGKVEIAGKGGACCAAKDRSAGKVMININTLAADIMTKPAHVVSADWHLTRALEFFLDKKISGSPVVDENGIPVGVLTLRDISQYAFWHLSAEESEDDSPAGGSEDESEEIVRKHKLAKDEDSSIPSCFHLDRMGSATVRQIMTPEVVTVKETSSLGEVLAMLHKKRLHRVFVTDSKGKISGVISTMDLVRWLRVSSYTE